MAAQLAKYFVVKDERLATLYQEGLTTTPRRVGSSLMLSLGWVLDEFASYLNQMSKTDYEHLQLLDSLLEASLCGRNLNCYQNEAANCLHYPGIDGYIAEKFTSKKEGVKEVKDAGTGNPTISS